MTRYLLPVICLSFIGLHPLCSEEEMESTECRAIFLERPRNAPSKAFLYDGTISHEVSLSGMNFSEPIRLTPGASYVAITSQRIFDPKNLPAEAPMVRFPLTLKRFYLICFNDPENPVFPVQLQLIDASDNKISEGQTLWMNLSNHQILCKLGDQRLKLEAGQKHVAKAPLSGSGYYLAQFAYKPGGNGNVVPIMNKTWWLDENSRYLGIIIGTGERLPKIYSLRDRVYAYVGDDSEAENLESE